MLARGSQHRVEFYFVREHGPVDLQSLVGIESTFRWTCGEKLGKLEAALRRTCVVFLSVCPPISLHKGPQKSPSYYPLSDYLTWVGNTAVSVQSITCLPPPLLFLPLSLFEIIPKQLRILDDSFTFRGCKPTDNKSNHFYSTRRVGQTNLVYKFYKLSK